MRRLAFLLSLSAVLACVPQQGEVDAHSPQLEPSAAASVTERPDSHPRPTADVVSVSTTAVDGGYEFAVGVSSPDTGCDRYADWWEVVSEDGDLLYRRPLAHSHVDEQPFVRSGGPVALDADETVWVRAHLHPFGYGGEAFRGSIAGGFDAADAPLDFAADLAEAPPAPPPCRF